MYSSHQSETALNLREELHIHWIKNYDKIRDAYLNFIGAARGFEGCRRAGCNDLSWMESTSKLGHSQSSNAS